MSRFSGAGGQIKKMVGGSNAVNRGTIVSLNLTTVNVQRYGSGTLLRNVTMSGASMDEMVVGDEVEIAVVGGKPTGRLVRALIEPAQPVDTWVLQDTLLAEDTDNFTLDNVPQDYRKLTLVFSWRGTIVATSGNAHLRLNDDASALYNIQYLLGQAAVPASGENIGGTSAHIATLIGSTGPASSWSDCVVEFPNYARGGVFPTWKSHALRIASVASAGLATLDFVGFLRVAGPVTKVVVRATSFASSDKFLSGSRMTAYVSGTP